MSWSEEFIPIDPMLTDLIDLHGSQARRRHLADAVARAFGWYTDFLTEPTRRWLISLTLEMVEVVSRPGAIDVLRSAETIGKHKCDSPLRALIELGYGSQSAPSCEWLRDLEESLSADLERYATDRALRWLRGLQKRGLILAA